MVMVTVRFLVLVTPNVEVVIDVQGFVLCQKVRTILGTSRNLSGARFASMSVASMD
jgi:hypothetical protein